MKMTSLADQSRSLMRSLREILYGMTVYEWIREVEKEKGSAERLFALVVFGDLLGVPILPPYYALRLLPYVVPLVQTWRLTLARERDLTDLFDQEIG